MAIFDIIGPVMIGPSSSHTAGAARIGYFAREIFGGSFDFVEVDLFNSFADTGKGHGTDIAIIGGLLGFEPDDPRILHSFEIASEQGMKFRINWNKEENEDLPPNTAKITFYKNSTPFYIVGNSIGGGKVEIININGYEVKLSGKHFALIISALDTLGIAAYITNIIAKTGINIASMDIKRDSSIGESLSVIKLDSEFPDEEIAEFYKNPNIKNVIKIRKLSE